MYKERHSWPTYVAGLTYFQGTWRLSHHGLQDVRSGGTIMACKTCGHAATVLHRPCWSLARHNYSAEWPDRTTSYRWSCATWRSDRTGCTPRRWRHHLLLLPIRALWYRVSTTPGPPVGPWGLIVTVRPWGIKGPSRHQYKDKFNLVLNNVIHTVIQTSHMDMVLRSGGPNHVKILIFI
jgi:hypothetical protein